MIENDNSAETVEGGRSMANFHRRIVRPAVIFSLSGLMARTNSISLGGIVDVGMLYHL